MAPRRDFRQTKIVCTLGPASSTPEQIEQLAAAGMNIARLNMSHGDHASHLQVIQVVQKLNERLNHRSPCCSTSRDRPSAPATAPGTYPLRSVKSSTSPSAPPRIRRREPSTSTTRT